MKDYTIRVETACKEMLKELNLDYRYTGKITLPTKRKVINASERIGPKHNVKPGLIATIIGHKRLSNKRK